MKKNKTLLLAALPIMFPLIIFAKVPDVSAADKILSGSVPPPMPPLAGLPFPRNSTSNNNETKEEPGAYGFEVLGVSVINSEKKVSLGIEGNKVVQMKIGQKYAGCKITSIENNGIYCNIKKSSSSFFPISQTVVNEADIKFSSAKDIGQK